MPVKTLVLQASPQDAPLLARLHAHCFDKAWDAEAMATFIRGPGTVCLIGFAGDDSPMPGGLLIARSAADEAELLTIGVAPACRHLGLGRALLAHAVAALAAVGTKRFFLEVDETNDAAIALYHAIGAKPVGRREGYYESGAAAAIFSLDLESCPLPVTPR